ncbi:electron transport complex subunit RsxC [candidate division KSB1 bacterium]|nr:MAG: electron transport complex subunit RsxC [candidate division KSB1 bacterium 4484_219]RKY79263.1 MAG: electron transport complex subunit RsxC [candidate division KSB1 bacterium]RKY87478.1 MAG: electron transport complex subunit RsxC [candidate division KSB1 bacterium]
MLGIRRRTFAGGVYPPEEKSHTEKKPIEEMPPPTTVVIPLQQHIGAPSEPIVKQGDQVRIGDRLSEPQGFVSVPVHASVSGTVQKIAPLPHPLGDQMLAIVIENDGQDTVTDAIKPDENYLALTPDEMRQKIKEAGIAGMGGATFPTHVKLSPPESKPIDILILNGAECEPYLTADHRLMLEYSQDIFNGLKIFQKILNVKKTYIAIEKNKPDAIRKMEEIAQGDKEVEVIGLKVKYPQGAEKQLIKAITGREVPTGGLPMDVGCLVQNVGTAKAVFDALRWGKPLYQRVITVSGPGIQKPKNLLVRIGTPFKDVIAFCGGYTETANKLVMGGPMMGLSQYTDEVPVIKGTSGIVVLDGKTSPTVEPSPCIGCGRCILTCPMGLVPTTIAQYVEAKNYEMAKKWNALDCIECGACTFVCPAKRPLLQSIRLGKYKIQTLNKKAG